MTSALNSAIQLLGALLVLAFLTPYSNAQQSTSSALTIKRTTTNTLHQYFSTQLKSPKRYETMALKACESFPEGDIFPFAYPCLAFINLSFSDAKNKTQHLKHAKVLLDQLIKQCTTYLRPKHHDLAKLASYQNEGTWMGTLNTCLGAYIHASGDKTLLPLHDHLSQLLKEALKENAGYPLRSYPTMTWPFDTTPVLLSLRLNDVIHDKNTTDTLKKSYYKWEDESGTHPDTKLPYSQVGLRPTSTMKPILPRGCDLSFRLCLLAQYDNQRAKTLYATYKQQFWRKTPLMSGFAEWPHGSKQIEDVDSGPIIMGIGLTASGMGLGASLACQDKAVANTLLLQLGTLNNFKPLLATGSTATKSLGIDFAGPHITGFLMGDAMLFYAITWHSWGLE